MPLYGYTKDATTTIVGAALNKEEFQKFFEGATEHFVEKEESDLMMHLTDPEFEKFSATVYIFTHTDAEQQAAFIAQYEILIGTHQRAVDRNTDMVNYDAPDPYLDGSDNRTIEEIYGLDKDDKWDKRTDEEKAADEELKKQLDEMKKKGELSNDDSFSAPKKGGVYVNDIRATTNADGSVTVDTVLATKVEEGEKMDDPYAKAEKHIMDQINSVLDPSSPKITKISFDDPNAPAQTPASNGFIYAVALDTLDIAIVSEAFFEANGHMDDDHIGDQLNLPENYEEVAEGMFIAHGHDLEEIRATLNGLGLRESEKFARFLGTI